MIKKKWSKEEEALLIALAMAGTKNCDIAKALGRPIGSIHHKRGAMGITEDKLRKNKKTIHAPKPEPKAQTKTAPADSFAEELTIRSINDAVAALNSARRSFYAGRDALIATSNRYDETTHRLDVKIETLEKNLTAAAERIAQLEESISTLIDDVDRQSEYLCQPAIKRAARRYDSYCLDLGKK